MITLNRPLAFFDTETTGVNIATDRIIELAIVKLMPDHSRISNTWKVNPGIPIPPQASAVHGIYDSDVALLPPFANFAKEIFEFLDNCDLAGYNSNSFDIPLLTEELLRCGFDLKPEERKCVDVMNVFRKMEQRNLSAAYRFYCNKELTNAHSAEADTNATLEILMAQLDRYNTLQKDINFLHDFTWQPRSIDFEGKFVMDEKGNELINFGKHKGKLIKDMLRSEPSYFDWMMKSDFSLLTKKTLSRIIKKYS